MTDSTRVATHAEVLRGNLEQARADAARDAATIRLPAAFNGRWTRRHWAHASLFATIGALLAAIVPGFSTAMHSAQDAIRAGRFASEITPVTLQGRKGEEVVSDDEQPLKANLDKIPQLKPAFKKDGTVTPANASSISDGAAALVLMRASEAERRGLTPLARIVGHSSHAQAPAWFTTAPTFAIEKLLGRIGWSADSVDLYEINEAFAVVTLAAMHDLKLPAEKVNVHGGACALGHPIGASGARIVVTLLSALQQYGLRRGVASLCIGGGEATALAIERM